MTPLVVDKISINRMQLLGHLIVWGRMIDARRVIFVVEK